MRAAHRPTAAETARVVAAEAARNVARDLAPVSVFISRKTQRLYVRRAVQPILQSPVTIRDVDRPIGTHVFTVMERPGGDDMRWSVVSLNGGHPDGGVLEQHDPARGRRGRGAELVSTDAGGAKAALDRITIPQDTLAVADDQCRGLNGRDDVQPYTGQYEAHSETGKTGRHPANECRQQKNSENHAIHGSLPRRSDQRLDGWLPSRGEAAVSPSSLSASEQQRVRRQAGSRLRSHNAACSSRLTALLSEHE